MNNTSTLKRIYLAFFVLLVGTLVAVVIFFTLFNKESEKNESSDSFLLKNVVAKENRAYCSSDLLGLDNAIGDLPVPKNLCIKYTNVSSLTEWDLLLTLVPYPDDDNRYFYFANTIKIWNTLEQSSQPYKEHNLSLALCRANQDYYTINKTTKGDWLDTPAGQEFISITGYEEQKNNSDKLLLPDNSPYISQTRPYDFYSAGEAPQELATTVCVAFLSPKTMLSIYSQEYIDNLLSNKQLQQWHNTYTINASKIPDIPQAKRPKQRTSLYALYATSPYDPEDIESYLKYYYRDNGTIEKVEFHRYYLDSPTITRYYTEDQKIEQVEVSSRSAEEYQYRDDGTLQSMKEVYLLYNETYYRADETIERQDIYDGVGRLEYKDYFRPDGTQEKREIYDNGTLQETIYYSVEDAKARSRQ